MAGAWDGMDASGHNIYSTLGMSTVLSGSFGPMPTCAIWLIVRPAMRVVSCFTRYLVIVALHGLIVLLSRIVLSDCCRLCPLLRGQGAARM
eukprot:127883-Pyramimonas_sp.AAC.1